MCFSVISLSIAGRAISKRVKALEDAPRFTPVPNYVPTNNVGVLRAQLKDSAFRTERIKYLGGKRDGQYEWVEKVPNEVENIVPGDHWMTRSIVETYRLVGVSASNPHVHLFEHVSTRAGDST